MGCGCAAHTLDGRDKALTHSEKNPTSERRSAGFAVGEHLSVRLHLLMIGVRNVHNVKSYVQNSRVLKLLKEID